MDKLDYMINPILMGGLIKEVKNEEVKVHLHGRLGVITLPAKYVNSDIPLEPGVETQFHFSYIQVVDQPYDYDSSSFIDNEFTPCLLGGTITEVNDTAIKVEAMDGAGTIAVPRRWAFTDIPLEVGEAAEFYMSPMRVIGKCDIPAESI